MVKMLDNQRYPPAPGSEKRGSARKMFRVQWHITDRCNLHCIHCYQDNRFTKNELSLEQIKKAARMLRKTIDKWGMDCEVSVTGGEPFMRKDWYRICVYMDSLGFYTSILTNGQLISKEIVAKLKRITNLRYVQVSLDGGTAEVHERVRGKGTFARALNSIKLLRRAKIKVATKFTVHRINVQDLKSYLRLTDKIGADFVSVARYIPWGRGESLKGYLLTKEETKKVYQTVLKYAVKSKGKAAYDTRRPLWALLKDDNNAVGGRCIAGFKGLTILHNGDVLPCRPMSVKIGNVLSNTFFEIWYTNPLLWMIRNFDKWKCGRCNLRNECGGCLAMSNAVYGYFFKEDPQCFKEIMQGVDTG